MLADLIWISCAAEEGRAQGPASEIVFSFLKEEEEGEGRSGGGARGEMEEEGRRKARG